MDALRVRTVGDSITLTPGIASTSPGPWGWADAPGGFYQTIMPQLAAKTGPDTSLRLATASGSIAVAQPGSYLSRPQPTLLKPAVLSAHGIGGSSVIGISQWPSRPDLIQDSYWLEFFPTPAELFIVQWAINDLVLITMGTATAADHLTAYGALLDRINLNYPNAAVLCMGCLFISDEWGSSGGNHYTGSGAGYSFPSLNPFNNNNQVDTNIRAAIAARPGRKLEYCDQISNALAYVVAHSTEPGPVGGIGVLSMNGLHPLLVCQQLMGTWVSAHLNFVTT